MTAKKCIMCGKSIPPTHRLYCSPRCDKRAWWCRRNPNAYFNDPSKYFDGTPATEGVRWEILAADLLQAKHLLFNHGGADLEKNGVFFDVKTASIHRRKNRRGKPVKKKQAGWWAFKKKGRYCKTSPPSFFFCIGLGEERELKKMFLVPNEVYPNGGLTISITKSKYDIYLFKV